MNPPWLQCNYAVLYISELCNPFMPPPFAPYPLPPRLQLVTLVKEGLRDFSISRSAVDWGIRFDQDPQHTVYVWFDALNGESRC